jgi:uncharacterized protein YdeI (YjbR/CyaY-like superfamily)
MIEHIEDYFSKGCGRCERFATPECSTRKWIDGLNRLRQLCLEAGLTETVKWGHPCYMHAGRNIAIIGAFRDNYRLTFFNAALMKDADGLLERQGPNTAYPDMIRFTTNAQPEGKAKVIMACLKEAMGYAENGIMPERQPNSLDLPDDLVDALDADSELAEAFRRLTPGRQKSYIINLNGAKAPATRRARIEKFRTRIMSGKGANEY